MATEFDYNDYVVVAHDEWKLRCLSSQTVEYSEYLGGYEWRVTFKEQDFLNIMCEEFKDKIVSDEFHLELFIYARNKEDYKLAINRPNSTPIANPSRTLITASSHSFSYVIPDNEFLAVNVRILKDRPLFHDFILEHPICHFQNDLKLKVGEEIFHVNKQMLELVSLYFHRMLNNPNFIEASKNTIDTGETDAALFQDFLLTIFPKASSKYTVLPNSKNLAGLMRLAHYYGVDSLFEKFEHSLKFCRELPIDERVILAKKYMDKKFDVGSILHGVNNPKELKRVCVALFKMDE